MITTLATVLFLLVGCGDGREWNAGPVLCEEVPRCATFCVTYYGCPSWGCDNREYICLKSTYKEIWGTSGPIVKPPYELSKGGDDD